MTSHFLTRSLDRSATIFLAIVAAVGVLLPEWLRFAEGWYLFVFGVSVVALMLWLPDGLLSIPDRIRARRQARAARAISDALAVESRA